MLTQAARRVDGWLSGVPFHPWLFAAYPVIRLYSENIADAEVGEILLPLLIVLAATTIGMAALSLLLRDTRRAAIIVSALLVPVLSFGLLRETLADALGLGRLVLVGLCVAAVVLAVIVALRIRGQLGALTSALNVLSAVILLLVAVPAAAGIADVLATPQSAARPALAVADPAARPTRDIYHVVLDRYGSERSFEAGFGIDNSDFTEWLRDQGFQVLDDSVANYARTLLSLGSTLGMSLLDDIVAAASPGSRNLQPVVERIRESRAGAFLQDLGYEYVHVGSWYAPSRDSEVADRVYQPGDARDFASTLFDLTILPQLLGSPTGEAAQAAAHADAAQAQWALLDEIADDPGPKYVFAHILLPHPPYVFLEDGTFAPARADQASQLAHTNDMLQRFLEPLLALPEDERPIVILQADEGPYPRRLAREQRGFEWAEATDEELITKFGILNAWLMPGPEGEAPLPTDMTAVNTYPELFRRAFGADIADQPDRVLASSVDTLFDTVDVTDRIAATEESDGAP